MKFRIPCFTLYFYVLFRANKQTLETKKEKEFKGKYAIAPVVTRSLLESEYKQLDPNNPARQRTSRVTSHIGGKSIAPDPAADEASSNLANFKSPGGPRVATDDNKEVNVVTESRTPTTQQPNDASPSGNLVQSLFGHYDSPFVDSPVVQ